MPNQIDLLLKRIKEDGPISLADYMATCNAHYYATRDPLGQGGDFTTAPEISQIFGELIGLWCAVVWRDMGAPDTVNLIELGPGRGTLMSDALRAARNVPGFNQAARLHLVETSPVLKDKQKQALGTYDPHWHDNWASIDHDAPWIVVGNEFLDALPIHQFKRTEDKWIERGVAMQDDKLTWCDLPCSDADLPDLNPGSIIETCPTALGLVDDLAAAFKDKPGKAIFIDYGYLGPASGETLQAMKGHGFADPLQNPGEQDLTAHVDFGAMTKRAKHAGITVESFGPMGQFLIDLGIDHRAEALKAAGAVSALDDVKRLTGPNQMGNLFKVMVIGS